MKTAITADLLNDKVLPFVEEHDMELPHFLADGATRPITKTQLEIEQPRYTILQIVSVSFFEKMLLFQAFQEGECIIYRSNFRNQLQLSDQY